jgi:hypothetical protein
MNIKKFEVIIGAFVSIVGSGITTYGVIHASHTNLTETRDQVKHTRAEINLLQQQTDKLEPLPVGSIVPSMLRATEFFQVAGESGCELPNCKWTLADGKAVPKTRYATLTDNKPVPDLRGIFLRGKSNGRSDGKGNINDSSGKVEDLDLGGYQEDMLQDHIHDFNRGGQGKYDGDYSQWVTENAGQPREQTYSITSGKHGAETRPRSVTVNYFIRIN